MDNPNSEVNHAVPMQRHDGQEKEFPTFRPNDMLQEFGNEDSGCEHNKENQGERLSEGEQNATNVF